MPPTTPATIRRLNQTDIILLRPCLAALADYHNRVATSFSGLYPTMPIDTHLAHMRDHAANDTALLIGLFLGEERLAGFGMASYEEGYGEVDYLFVEEELRGQGWGGKMLEELLTYLRAKRVSFVDLNVVLGNPAKRFYEKHGFATRSEVVSRKI